MKGYKAILKLCIITMFLFLFCGTIVSGKTVDKTKAKKSDITIFDGDQL